MPPITVVLAEHEKLSRDTCLRLLRPEKRVRVAAQARSGMETVAAAAKFKPRILLLDLDLSLGNGVALLPVLRRRSPRTRVILLIGRASEGRLLEALSYGALGYLERKGLETFLLKAIQAVDTGGAWVPRKMVAKIVDRLARLTEGSSSYQQAAVRE